MSAEPRLPLLRTRRGVPDAHLGDCPFATSESTRRVRCHSNGVIGEEHEGPHPCSGRRRLLPPPDYPQLFRRAAPRPSKSLRRSRHPSYAACPGRALPRCASPRAAAACWGSRRRCEQAAAAGGGGRWQRRGEKVALYFLTSPCLSTSGTQLCFVIALHHISG